MNHELKQVNLLTQTIEMEGLQIKAYLHLLSKVNKMAN